MIIDGEYWKMSITPDYEYDPNVSMYTFKNNRSQEKAQKYSQQKVVKYVIYK